MKQSLWNAAKFSFPLFEKNGQSCYRATCYATTRLLQASTDISFEKSSTAFQWRLTKQWLRPFADEQVIQLAQPGVNKLLVDAPAFVTDCSEAIVEIGSEHELPF